MIESGRILGESKSSCIYLYLGHPVWAARLPYTARLDPHQKHPNRMIVVESGRILGESELYTWVIQWASNRREAPTCPRSPIAQKKNSNVLETETAT